MEIETFIKRYIEKSIQEEEEAINAYAQRMESIDEIIQTEDNEELAEKLTQIYDKIKHIKEEEQEHLQELHELKSLVEFENYEEINVEKFLVPDPRKQF